MDEQLHLLANTTSAPRTFGTLRREVTALVDVLGVKRMQAQGVEDPNRTELAPVSDRARGARLAEAYLRSLGHEIPADPPAAEE